MLKDLLVMAAALMAAACPPAERPVSAAAGAGGTLIVGNKGEDTVSFIDLSNGGELERVATGRMPHEIAVSPDGHQAAVVAYGGTTIDIFDVASRRFVRRIDLAPNERPHGLLWRPDGRIVATTEKTNSIAVIDTGSGDRISSIRTEQRGSHMTPSRPMRGAPPIRLISRRARSR